MIKRPSLLREEYMIDRHAVVFESGCGWLCVCEEFTRLTECRHTRESAGRRAAQELIRTRVDASDGTLSRFENRIVP